MSDNNNLDFISELGIGLEDATPTDAESNNTNESNIDLDQDSNTEESKTKANQNTEADESGLRKQIEGLEKRIADKDEYINLLREQSKAKEESSSIEEDNTQTDFWDDPEKIVKEMQQNMKLQQLQLQEIGYANTVENYWKTVNPEALQQAVATDAEFAKKFNSSSEPYRDAYEYLSKKAEKVKTDEASLKEQIRAELMKEMGLDKPKKEGVPNMGTMGGSSGSSKSEAPEDGFSSVFGQSY